jgi:hypothetical protein
VKFKSMVSAIGKPVNASEALTGRSSRWIAGKFGVSMRTAQRWRKGTQQPTDKGDRREKVMKSADADTRRKVAAEALRDARAVNVGRVQVVDKSPRGKGKGRKRDEYRNVGVVQLDGTSRDKMREAADALESGDTDRAERLMSEAVLTSPGKNYGSALDVADWPAHLHLI